MAVELANIYKSFGQQNIFTNFNAKFETGAFTAIMGSSGSGKTTLINLICGLMTPDYGNINGIKGHKISAVFQEDRLLEHQSGLKNIQYVLKKSQLKDCEQDIWELLVETELAEDAHKRARDYSGGMKRRLALCRALVIDFDIIILDEPFKGLDSGLKPKIMALTKARCAEKTVILVTHDVSEAVYFGGDIVNIR